MNIPAEFDEIRPYEPEELPQIFEELIADPAFQAVVSSVLPNIPMEMLSATLRQCKTNLDVQKNIFHGLLHDIMDKCSDGFDLDASALPDKQASYTFISNHRDIVLDPGFLSVGLIDNGFPTTVEIAIGDNLLIYPWIKKLVRVNKSFIVQRTLSMRQMLESSARMSRYIHFAITEKKENVWIAQREGRAKDSDDRTQESVLKMLCDFLKAQEMQQKRDIPGFKKSQEDDLQNMQTGIFGYKGHVHFHATSCINEELEQFRNLPKTEIFTQIAQLIDKKIHANYRLYPGNYIACDTLEGNTRYADHYTAEDKKRFEAYLQKRIDLIQLPDKDEAFLRDRILTMYANPVINHQKAVEA